MKHMQILWLALAACGPTTINITSSGDGTGDEGREPGTTGSTRPGATGADGASDTTGSEPLQCNSPPSPGDGGIVHPEPGYTVSGCFDDAATFGCGTCGAWCEAGGYGACVGAAPLDDCENEGGLGYTIDCGAPIDMEAAWKCVCSEPGSLDIVVIVDPSLALDPYGYHLAPIMLAVADGSGMVNAHVAVTTPTGAP